MAFRANGHVRSYGTVYGVNTLAYPVGTILYASTTAGELTSTAPTAPNHRIAIALVTRQHQNTGRIFVRTYTPAYRLADLSNVASTSPVTGQGLVWNGTAWAPGSVGYTPGSPPPGGFLGNVFYQDNAGNFTFEDEFRYTASTNTLAVENITGTTVTGSGVVKGSNTFGQRYATQAATNRAAADTASLTVERYFTVTAEGNGESFNIQSDTPSAGNKIVRKIWYKDEAFEDTDVDTWTLLHTFADDATYASTATKWQEYLDGQANGTPPFTLAISWEEVNAATPLLTGYTANLGRAYATALLNPGYTGDCIRVRRASDNTEQDIGFDGIDLDTAALTTFCTGTDCFIRTWYDQSGNGNDAGTTSTANQPKIYDSSTGVVQMGSEAGVQFLSTDGLSFASITPITTFVIAKIDTLNIANYIAWGSGGGYFMGGTAAGINGLGVFQISGSILASTTGEDLNAHLGVWHYDTTKFQIGNNGASLEDLAATNNLALTSFSRTDSGGANFLGTVQAFICYTSSAIADRAAIETALNDYFNVY
jgi:hypothetical protein